MGQFAKLSLPNFPTIQYIYVHGIGFVNVFTIDLQCDNLSIPANGEITSCSSGTLGVGYEGDTCSFTCNTGYELNGSDTRTCQNDGSWNGSDAVCTQGMSLGVN